MKKFKLLFLMILTFIMLVGCSSSKLSDAYNEEEVRERAITVIELLNEENYESIESMMSDLMKSHVPSGEIEKAWQPVIKKIGDFKEIKKDTVVGNGELATAAVMTKYKNSNITFTITFNEELELDGLFFK